LGGGELDLLYQGVDVDNSRSGVTINPMTIFQTLFFMERLCP
jgi:hypothetical protein|tara:strand:+ start:269 stop:394 length:126 start_codon:yes stop_codon:yes gene_type:complete